MQLDSDSVHATVAGAAWESHEHIVTAMRPKSLWSECLAYETLIILGLALVRLRSSMQCAGANRVTAETACVVCHKLFAFLEDQFNEVRSEKLEHDLNEAKETIGNPLEICARN